MSDKKHIVDRVVATRLRWNIAPQTETQQVEAFRVRLKKTFLSEEGLKDEWDYHHWYNLQKKMRFHLGIDGYPEHRFLSVAAMSSPIPTLALSLQTMIDIEFGSNPHQPTQIGRLVEHAVVNSPGAPIALAYDDHRVILYPAGAKLLDQEVVDQTLHWLEGHPAAIEKFEGALVGSMKGVERRKILDDLRFALERLLKDILNNDKSLENQKPPLGLWLKERGLNPQVVNMFQTLTAQFGLYQNDAVKHDDSSHPEEVEFMIYLTATFMRLLLQVERTQQKPGTGTVLT